MIATMATRLVSPITIGRRTELDAALGVLDAAIAGSVTHLLITGEAGVGKTRLVGELAAAATARGVRVLRGSCASVGDQGLPYGPIVEILAEVARGTEPDELLTLVGTSGADLARLVPALDPSSSAAHVQREFLQARLLDALAGLLRRLSESAPVLVIVEDVHWADPATRETLGFLVRTLRTEPVVVAMTLRSDELHRRHPAMPWISELERTGRVSRIDLARLDADETAAMLASITGEAPSAMVASRFHRRSDGNPFFIEELVLAETGQGSARLPSTLQEILATRLGALSEPARSVVGIVAAAGRRIDHDLLAQAADRLDVDDLDAALRDAIASQILVVDADTAEAEGYAFRHALLAEVAYDDLLPGERRRLHRACAEALAARPTPTGAPAAAHWAELAHHWAHAHEPVNAFTASLEAAAAAEATYAFEASLRQYERAIDLWTSVPDPEGLAGADQAEILLRAAQMAHLAALGGRCVALRREAIAVVGEGAGPVRLAVMHEALGRALWANGDSAESLAEYELAVAAMPAEPPTAERARVLSGYGQMLMLLDRWQESAALCEEAIAIAQLVGAREAEGHARNTLGLDIAAQGRCEEAIASLELALAIAREVGNVDDIGRAHVNLSEAMLFCGFPRDAADAVERGIVEADAIGISGSYGSVIRHNGIQVNFDLGRWETAARLAADSLTSGPVGEINPDRYRISRWVPLIVATGEFELAGTQLDRLAELLDGVPVEAQFSGNFHAATAELALWEGRPADALDEIERGLERIGDQGWLWFNARLHRIGARAAADVAEQARSRRDRPAVDAALRRGEALRAARHEILARMLEHEHGRQAAMTIAEGALADAEDTRLRGSSDAGAWAAARESWAKVMRPYLEAYAAWREGEAYLVDGDRAAAATALRSAHSTASGLGARPLREAIESLAKRARIDLVTTPTAGGGTAAPADPFGLTKREREVLALVALGRTNRQIADELFISENTAGVHVSNILGKLGVASRTEAAAVAVRLDLAAATVAE